MKVAANLREQRRAPIAIGKPWLRGGGHGYGTSIEAIGSLLSIASSASINLLSDSRETRPTNQAVNCKALAVYFVVAIEIRRDVDVPIASQPTLLVCSEYEDTKQIFAVGYVEGFNENVFFLGFVY